MKASASFPVGIPATTLISFQDRNNPYIHLMDGGVADNLGIMTAIRVLEQDPAYHKVLILIDAYNGTTEPFSKSESSPFAIQAGFRSTDIGLDSWRGRSSDLLKRFGRPDYRLFFNTDIWKGSKIKKELMERQEIYLKLSEKIRKKIEKSDVNSNEFKRAIANALNELQFSFSFYNDVVNKSANEIFLNMGSLNMEYYIIKNRDYLMNLFGSYFISRDDIFIHRELNHWAPSKGSEIKIININFDSLKNKTTSFGTNKLTAWRKCSLPIKEKNIDLFSKINEIGTKLNLSDEEQEHLIQAGIKSVNQRKEELLEIIKHDFRFRESLDFNSENPNY